MFHFSFSFISKQIINIDWNMNFEENKAGYTATPVACGWAGAVIEVIWAGTVKPKIPKTLKK